MAAKLTTVTHKIAIQLHLVAESCMIYSSRSRRAVRKLLDTASNLILFREFGNKKHGNYEKYLTFMMNDDI
jgi:hypothetical protein